MKKGFSLLEMMIVIVIIGILAGFISAKMGMLIDKSKDGYTKGQLTSLRSALNIYYSDNSIYPKDNLSSLVPQYISKIPIIKLVNTSHPENSFIKTAQNIETGIDDSGGWLYINDENNSNWGRILINCTHIDLNGNIWSSY